MGNLMAMLENKRKNLPNALFGLLLKGLEMWLSTAETSTDAPCPP
jgi:hypothetical protein